MLKATFKKYQLQFKSPVLTSRGQMQVKNGYYLSITDGEYTGVGECSFIEGLSIDDLPNYEGNLQLLCEYIQNGQTGFAPDLTQFPSINFGWETAMLDLQHGGSKILFESEFTAGNASIPINGLVWMGSKEFMQEQIERKIADGFNCIKIKVGAIDFEEETMLLKFIRSKFPSDVMEIRLDANGAFTKDDVFKKLEMLSVYNIHSIEQPIKAGQWELMADICKQQIIPVALDEELIPILKQRRSEMLNLIKPQHIILKPSLLGGIKDCKEWIALAKQMNIRWWATSALESNIGLNAIAQWVFNEDTNMVQGLGTGGLYINNISSPLYINKGQLRYNANGKWDVLP